MSQPTMTEVSTPTAAISSELARLREQVGLLPTRLRGEMEPMVEEVIEEALFRGRVLSIAREGLERYRLDLKIVQFDLEATRREREDLRRKLEALGV